MPLCRASAEDLQDYIMDLMHQQDVNLYQMRTTTRQSTQAYSKLGQYYYFLRYITYHLHLLRYLSELKRSDVPVIAQRCITLLHSKEEAHIAVYPSSASASAVTPGNSFFSLSNSAGLLLKIQIFQEITAGIYSITPFDAARDRRILHECQAKLREYETRTDDTKHLAERIGYLKIENAALREQAMACSEQLSGEQEALLMKIEALAKYRQYEYLQARESSRNTSALYKQVDKCLERIDQYIDADRIAADYRCIKEKLVDTERELNARRAELADIKKDAVSVVEYNYMKAYMYQKFEDFRAEAARAEKMGYNDIYREYLLLLQKINANQEVI